MDANIFESKQSSICIPNSNSFGSSGENVIFGGNGSSLIGTSGVDVFVITSPGANISDFEVGKDKVGIIARNEPLTFLDIINLTNPTMLGKKSPNN